MTTTYLYIYKATTSFTMGCAHWVGYFICCIIIKLQIYKATADYESAKKWYQDGLLSMTDNDKIQFSSFIQRIQVVLKVK